MGEREKGQETRGLWSLSVEDEGAHDQQREPLKIQVHQMGRPAQGVPTVSFPFRMTLNRLHISSFSFGVRTTLEYNKVQA